MRIALIGCALFLSAFADDGPSRDPAKPKSPPGFRAAKQETRNALLQYGTKVPDDSHESGGGGGGMAGAVDEITRKMNEPPGTGGGDAKASLGIVVRPVLLIEGDAWSVTLELVGEPAWHVDSSLPPGVADGCTADKARVLDRLQLWSTALDAGQIDELKKTHLLRLPVKEPFAKLEYLSDPRLEISVACDGADEGASGRAPLVSVDGGP